MRMVHVAICALCGAIALAGMTLNAEAGGVAVGASTLIKVLDYSDTFTAYDYGGLEDRDGTGGWNPGSVDYPATDPPTPGQGLAVENCYGNPARSWSDWKWSNSSDAYAIPGTTPWAGGSGVGSETGMTQTGGTDYYTDWGIEYGLRNRYVVQFDGVQTMDRVDIMTGTVRDAIFDPGNISVFVRTAGHMVYPEISIFNATVGEVSTGWLSPVVYANEWHNYAALFDVPERTIELFVDQVSLGVIDLDTFAEGAFAAVPMSNAAVSVGFSQFNTGGQDRFWSDNFQVGSPDAVNPVQIPGDADGNQIVNAADAQRLAENWGATTLNTNYTTWWEMGDFNGDETVNAADASILAANWLSTGESSAAVPEPSTLLLLAAGLGTLGLVRRRQ